MTKIQNFEQHKLGVYQSNTYFELTLGQEDIKVKLHVDKTRVGSNFLNHRHGTFINRTVVVKKFLHKCNF